MFQTQDVLVDGVIAGLIAGALTLAFPWARARFRFLIAAVATFLGFIAWNFVISNAKATGLDVDSQFLNLSWQDVGSGVLAFASVSLALGVIERREPAGAVAMVATVAGVSAMVFDIFVL